ncbi:MAG: hypothetical protein RI894_1613 [Bacteroidota bacterium]
MLETLQNELREDCIVLQRAFEQASETIRDEKVSHYPIFVLHRDEYFPIGLPLIQSEKHETRYSYNVSTLEEMVAKKIVEMDNVDEFRKIYKSPDDFFCFLIVDTDAEGAPHPRFWFVPIGGLPPVNTYDDLDDEVAAFE